ncbi:MAG: segregation/condensation protein A [Christensenellaceae bacterium]|nr:segregation/condensation protein A [Christensenellaceae bacterium]
MAYELKLTNFEGPLDLLLHLISKAKIEPKDIFVSQITEQYLDYMAQAELLDLESASDFLQMAATLLYIKSRSLLPEKRQEEDLDENGLTPEQQLVARLNEYKRYKEVAAEFRALEERGRSSLYKLPEEVLAVGEQQQNFTNSNVDALMAAYLKVLARIRRSEQAAPEVVIYRDQFSVKKQMKVIMARLTIKARVRFEELLSLEPTREELAVTFLSLLELLHGEKVSLKQEKAFDEIIITKREGAKA